jgi:hypothetical protein
MASDKNVAVAESLLTAVSEAAPRRYLSRERLDRFVRRNEHVAGFDEMADRTGIGDDKEH